MPERDEDLMPDARAVERSTPGVSAEAGGGQVLMDESSEDEQTPAGRRRAEDPDGEPVARDYLGDLQRLQAEFQNFRKRTMKEQGAVAGRAQARLVERLLPVLDNFDLAVAHGEGGAGIELALKELTEVLRSEGLEEIPAEGAPFDPSVHEAVESHEDPEVTGPIVTKVWRRGFVFKEQLLRPAMVVVSRPATLEEG